MDVPLQARWPGRPAALVWFGWLLPPFWWLTQFQVRYSLVGWCCRTSHRWVVPAAGFAALVVAIALTFAAWSAHRRYPEVRGRKFTTTVACWNNLLFMLLIVVQLVPDLYIDPCLR